MTTTTETTAPAEPQRYFTVDEAARYLRVSRQVLDKHRHYGTGPRFIRVSRKVIRYDRADLDEWMRERLHSAVAEYRDREAA